MNQNIFQTAGGNMFILFYFLTFIDIISSIKEKFIGQFTLY